MFEEALQKAPREELVEHIRLQRELIQRLHRRVVELETSLEQACATSQAARDDEDCAQTSSSTSVKGIWAPAERSPPHADTAAAPKTPPSVVSPRVRKRAAWMSSLSKSATPSTSPGQPQRRATITISATCPSTNLEGEFKSSMAPEPRRGPPVPYAEKSTSGRHASSLLSKANTQMVPVSSSAVVTSMSAHDGPSVSSPSPSDDHPTVLEGIKEINYVLAAHRAGRPSLPLSVVEELEEIRGRLLQGFKQMWLTGREEPECTRDKWARDAPSLEAITHSRVHAIRRSFGEGSGTAAEVDCVCPRWVSPDASRVVYGESPHHHL
jgi:hypothetical protein